MPAELKFNVKCPKCGRPIRVQARTAAPGSVLRCTCGKGSVTIAGDDLRKTQRAMDDLKKALSKLGKIR